MSDRLGIASRIIASRYEVHAVLGRGATAEVLEAFDRVLNRRVAIKVLREGEVPDPQAVSRFRREAQAAAALSHPSVVRVYDVAMDGDRPFIVMELVAGEPLSTLANRQGRLPATRVAAIGEAIAEALACAHAAGIVHRDLKPGNVMVGPDGHVTVLDFGIAHALDWTPVDEPFGTAEYVSPEQVRGTPLDGRSDLYALGVVLYELLAGRPPFTGGSPLAVAHRQVAEEPRPLYEVRPDVPAGLAAIVHRCLLKEAAARYASAREVAHRLALFRADAPASTPVVAIPVVAVPVSTDPIPRFRDTRSFGDVAGETDVKGGRASRRNAARLGPPRSSVAGPWVLASLALVVALVGVSLPFVLRARPAANAGPAARPSPAVHPLGAPFAMHAEGRCNGFMKARAALSWQPAFTRNADGYVVYRAQAVDGPYEKIALVSGRFTTTFTDAGLGLGEIYFYRVRATSGVRLSEGYARARVGTPFPCF